MKRDWLMLRPPMRAYSSWVALRKVLWERKWARKIAQACKGCELLCCFHF